MRGIPDTSFQVTPPPLEALDLTGRSVVVIGGTDGLGRAIAKTIAERGGAVTVVGRTFRDEGVKGLSFRQADLSSMKAAAALGRDLPVEGVDTVVFTTGIIAAKKREVTGEGLERDMAISFLSRLAALTVLAPRIEAEARGAVRPPRVFVMGFPGAGNRGNVDDLNAEGKYDAMEAHANTVAGNEALVLEFARRFPTLRVFGLNPGLIKTKIRANFMGEGSLSHRVTEFLIGLFTPTAESYAARIVPVLFAPELDAKSPALFGAKGQPILPSSGFDEAYVQRFLDGSRALITRALAG